MLQNKCESIHIGTVNWKPDQTTSRRCCRGFCSSSIYIVKNKSDSYIGISLSIIKTFS